MRVLVAGATGVIGRAAVVRLREAGHTVIATTRTPNKADALETDGIEPVVLDILNAEQSFQVVAQRRPEVVVNMVTDLSTPPNFRTLDTSFASTNRLRREGTDHLLAACLAGGVRHYVGQGFAGWFVEPGAARLTDEKAPFLAQPPRAARRTAEALQHLERRVTGSGSVRGVVLRFGPLYGPGTSMGPGGPVLEDVRRRRIPVIGGGGGTWSFTHVEDAGAAVAFAVNNNLAGVFNVVDNEPAPVAVWLPELAQLLGAPAPRSMPAWLARPLVGGFGVHVMTEARAADNAAVRSRGLVPIYPSWRDGFRSIAL